MKRETSWKRILIQCVSLAVLIALATLSLADVLMPESGKKTKKNGSLVIDYSHMDQGYVMVKSQKGKKKLREI